MKKIHFIVLILFIIFLIRLPFLFEPHWYFDETVYLTISQAMHRGAVLYRDIYDLKPPLIYFTYFLGQSHLLWMRLLVTFFVMTTSFILYRLSKSLLVMLVFGGLASTTIFEGGVANTEIFMIFPISLAFLYASTKKLTTGRLLSIGLLFGVAFLYKIVAIFDLVAIILFIFLAKQEWQRFLKKLLFVFLGFLFPLFLISLYFLLNHAFWDFIRSVFLYNSSYIYPQNLFLKTILLSTFYFLLFKYRDKIKPFQLLLYIWFSSSLFGALFGGRPYPHYLIQVLPSFSLIIGSFSGDKLNKFFRQPKLVLLVFLTFFIFLFSFFYFHFYVYPVRSYYYNFLQYIIGYRSQNEYQKFFNPLLPSIYQAGAYLKENAQPEDLLFVIGDYPQLYELSGIQPATRFLALRHIDFVPGAKKQIIVTMQKNPPEFMVFLKNEQLNDHEFENFFKNNYSKCKTFGEISIYELAKSI